jgi:hypothetical protein
MTPKLAIDALLTNNVATNLDILRDGCCDNHFDSGVVLRYGRIPKNPPDGSY